MKRTAKEPKSQIPKFKSYEEEAEFWDTHSPLDFPGEFEPADDIVIIPSLSKAVPGSRERKWLINVLSRLSEKDRQDVVLQLIGLTGEEIAQITRPSRKPSTRRRTQTVRSRKVAPRA